MKKSPQNSQNNPDYNKYMGLKLFLYKHELVMQIMTWAESIISEKYLSMIEVSNIPVESVITLPCQYFTDLVMHKHAHTLASAI